MAVPVVRTERACAKINLLLRILARESSGYHGIETLFQRLALHDTVTVAVHEQARTLTCDGPTMPAGGLGAPEQNLAWRAAALYASAAGWDTGWTIAIEKQIPVGGGLGGGSADAAAVLRALDGMAPSPLGYQALLELAGTLGADVPFLVANTSRALAWGRGDRLLPLPALPVVPVTLVTFADGVHTGQAYGAFASLRDAAGEVVRARAYAPDAFDSWASLCALAANDFERVVPAMHTGVATALPMLKALAAEMHSTARPACALLSGSGATCFVLHAPDTTLAPVVGPGASVVRTTTA